MQPLDLKKLTPWNLGALHPIFLGEMSVNPKTLQNITFKEVCSMHKSPTVSVSEEQMKVMAKETNKYLQVSSYASSSKPLRPDLSDIEISLIHATWGNVPVKHMAETLNITEVRLKQIRKATEHLYKQHESPLPSLPLVHLTDTSRYWTEDEVLETYGELKTHKDLLRGVERQSKELNLPINAKLYSEEDNKDSIHNRASIPSEVPWQDEEGYRELSDILWTYVSREDEISGTLCETNGDTDNTLSKSSNEEGKLKFTDWNPDNPVVQVPVFYRSSIVTKGKTKVIDHNHTEGGYYPPLNIPKTIIRLATDIINNFTTSAPSLENLVLHLMSSLEYTTSKMNVNLKPLSSSRGHCLPMKGHYIHDTSPLLYPRFDNKSYGYGIICHDCSTFLANHTVNHCKHLKFAVYYHQKPLIYLYSTQESVDYSLYYYELDEFSSISSIFTLNLLPFYTNFSLPLHKTPFEG